MFGLVRQVQLEYHNNSIQHTCLLTCRFNRARAYYKVSTKTKKTQKPYEYIKTKC